MTTLTTETVTALAEGTKGATPGPWIRNGVRHKVRDEDCLMVGPDGFSIAAVPIGRLPNEHAGAFRDAGFIAMCNPEFIRALCEDWLRQRTALEFYADPDTYVAIAFWPDRPCGEFMNDFTYSEMYDRDMPGSMARSALSSLPEEKNPS